MFFYLDYRFSTDSATVGVNLFDTGTPSFAQTNCLYLQAGCQRLEKLDTPGGKLLLLGDPVFRNRPSLGKEISPAPGEILETLLYETIRGHYYWFLIHPEGICCGASFGGIFPVYYHIGQDRAVLCSASFFLADRIDAPAGNSRNLLERLLFNYPFFPNTWWASIRLLDAHRYLRITRAAGYIDGQFEIRRFFGHGEGDSRRHLLHLVELFEAESGLFFPETRFGISFTGGFDGRTLLAAARKAGRRDFLTYSFGRPGASDVTFPEAQTKKLGIPYFPVLLDQTYLEQYAAESAAAFMRLTEYNGNFGRPHYHYAARLLARQVDYLITGNFGSEMFRALHQPGVMMTEQLIRVFAAPDQSWKDALRLAATGWNGACFREELDELIADLEQYLAPMSGWEPNHKFYHFVFNEIFRKYFGPELIMQSHYLNNRTPFLSLRFFRALNDTIWSGVHSRLFEKQKNKRLKGQIFYSSFLRHTDPQLYRQPTSKGYSPADVLERWRWPLLAGKVLMKKYLEKPECDSNAETAFWDRCRAPIQQRILEKDDGFLHAAGMIPRLREAEARNDLETAIRLCSIAEGWTSAKTSVMT